MRRMSTLLLGLGLLSFAWAALAGGAALGSPQGDPLLRVRQEAKGARLVFADDDSNSDDDDSDNSDSGDT